MKHEFNALLLNPEKSHIESIKIKTDFFNGANELSVLMNRNIYNAGRVDARTAIIFQDNIYNNRTISIPSHYNLAMEECLVFIGNVLILGGSAKNSEFCDVEITKEQMNGRVIFSKMDKEYATLIDKEFFQNSMLVRH